MISGKHVVIIGATGGIGSRISRKLAELGNNLVLVARNEERLMKLQEGLDCPALAVAADMTVFREMKNAAKRATAEFGPVDALIVAAGSVYLRPLHATPEKEFLRTLELNLIGPFYAIKAFIRNMLKQKKGSVIVFSSAAGSTGLASHGAIAAAKGGLEAMIRSTAITYAKRGIRFNCIALGLVNTPLAKIITGSELALEASLKLHPLGKIGEPEDFLDLVLYLASDRSKWTTGAVFHVDGGLTAGRGL